MPNAIFKPRANKIHCTVQTFLNLCSEGRLQEALVNLDLIAQKGYRLSSKNLAVLLLRIGDFKDLRLGKWAHHHLKVTGMKRPDTLLANHLIDMYSKCGYPRGARKVFDKMSVRNLYSWNNMLSGYAKQLMVNQARNVFDNMPERDVVSWNTMIIAYAKSERFAEALGFYRELRRLGIGFNEFSLSGVVTVCVKMEELRLTRQVHCQVLTAGFEPNVVLSSSILDAYARCGVLFDARRLFDEMGSGRDVLAWTTLVSGYAKSGDMKSARKLFDEMPERNPVSWTALVSGYARSNMGHEALELFMNMMRLRIRPDQFTFSSALCACASIAALRHGKQIHAHLMTIGFRPNSIVVSKLVDMYSKCGCMELAKRVFDNVDDKWDVVLWNTMLSAFADHGSGDQSIRLFDEMVGAGVKPDEVTFLALLKACSHSGLVNEGLGFFESMDRDYNVIPDQEHYACLIDIFGRAGRFDEAVVQLRKMPFKADGRVWSALIGACMIRGNSDLGRIAARHLLESDPQSPMIYVLLSSINAAQGKWESVVKLRQLMDEKDIRKEQGLSWLEVDRNFHQITGADELRSSIEEANSTAEQADQISIVSGYS